MDVLETFEEIFYIEEKREHLQLMEKSESEEKYGFKYLLQCEEDDNTKVILCAS